MHKAPVTCAAPCCRVPVEEGRWMCEAHWAMLPARLRNALHLTRRARHVSAFQENWTEALLLLDPTPGIFEPARPRRTTPPTIAYEGERAVVYATGRML